MEEIAGASNMTAERSPYSQAEIDAQWPGAAAALRGLAGSMRRANDKMTARAIDMAVWMAHQYQHAATDKDRLWRCIDRLSSSNDQFEAVLKGLLEVAYIDRSDVAAVEAYNAAAVMVGAKLMQLRPSISDDPSSRVADLVQMPRQSL